MDDLRYRAVMQRLWERMTAMFSDQFSNRYGAHPYFPRGSPQEGDYTPAGREWAEALMGIPNTMIGEALNRVRDGGFKFPPNLSEFKALCFDFPSIDHCKDYLLGRGVEPTPFALAVSRKIDRWEFRNADVVRAERLLRNAYELVRMETMRGDPLPTVPKAIAQEKREREPAKPETVAASLAKIHEALRLNPDGSPIEPEELETKE